MLLQLRGLNCPRPAAHAGALSLTEQSDLTSPSVTESPTSEKQECVHLSGSRRVTMKFSDLQPIMIT